MSRAPRSAVAVAIAVLVAVGGAALWWAAWAPRQGAVLRRLRRTDLAGRAAGFNVLLITIDTLRADRLGCYGHAAARTPAIDGLARRGVRYTQAIAPAPMTLPSHSSVLTGLEIPSHGVHNNGGFALADEHHTWAELLRQQGYRTAAFIAAFVLDGRYGLSQGFDLYDDDCNPRGQVQSGAHFNQRSADWVTAAALKWFEQGAAQPAAQQAPFFAWVHYFDPHAPYEPPSPQREVFANDLYDGEIAFVDTQVRRLLDALDRHGVRERTLVVVRADHGEGLGEHEEDTHAYLIYDSTVHVPLILSNAALFDGAFEVSERVVGLIDVMPTVLGLLGVTCPAAVDGIDVLTHAGPPGRAMAIETMATLLNNGWAPLYGLRTLANKFISAPTPEFYDVVSDPAELNNLGMAGAAARGLADRLRKRMAAWPEQQAVVAGAAQVPDEEAARLAALGYVGSDVSEEAIGTRNPRDMMRLWKRILLAETASGAGRHVEALAIITPALDADPNNSRGWTIRALIHKRLQQMSQAEDCLKKALALRPTADGYVLLAQMLLARGEGGAPFEGALTAAERLDPRHGGIFVARGDRWAMVGRFKEAMREFERAAELDPVRFGPIAAPKIELARQQLDP